MTRSPQSYTVMWPMDRCKWLDKAGETGKPIQVIFGGTHQSIPSLSHFKVQPGDAVYPIYVVKGVMHVIARLTISEIVPLETYLRDVLKLPRRMLELPLFDLTEVLEKEMPHLGHRMPYGCLYEAGMGEGTPMRWDVTVPPAMLESIRYQSSRGERPIKHVENGVLKRTISIHGGVYRLSDASAKDFERLVGVAD
jgi:hypothetical protein